MNLLPNAEINFPYLIRLKQCRGTNKVQILKNKILQNIVYYICYNLVKILRISIELNKTVVKQIYKLKETK
ncbi:hypothetical protein D3C78_1950450 [compost metagenome]